MYIYISLWVWVIGFTFFLGVGVGGWVGVLQGHGILLVGRRRDGGPHEGLVGQVCWS